ncbi:MAG: hypothetical protein NVS3B20_04180 [Polyangiales bacterium]
MIRPTRDQLSTLSTTERLSFEFGDVVTRRLTKMTNAGRTAFMGVTIWGAGGRRLNVLGLEHLRSYGDTDRVLLVANHRSFFDFFVITAVLYWRTQLSRRVLCPVRSTFFYDHPMGPAVNLLMSGMSMFPPILRDPKRGTFNRYSLERCVAELERKGTVMGLHPEGTRNKGSDPYAFLPAQPGVGKVALDAKSSRVHPVFIVGITNDLREEVRRNWLAPADYPIDIEFGPAIDLERLRDEGSRPANALRAAKRCLAAIAELAEKHRVAHR